MALSSSGALTLTQIQSEFGGSSPVSLSEYYRSGSLVIPSWAGNTGIPTSGPISLSDFYGARDYPTQTIYKKTGNYSTTLSAQPKWAVIAGARFLSGGSGNIVSPSVNGSTASTVINRSNTNLGDYHACGIWKVNLGTETSFSFNASAADIWMITIIYNVTSLATTDTGYTNGDGTTISTSSQGFAMAGAVNNFSGIGSSISGCNDVYANSGSGDECILGVDTATSGSNIAYNASGTNIQLTVAASFAYG